MGFRGRLWTRWKLLGKLRPEQDPPALTGQRRGVRCAPGPMRPCPALQRAKWQSDMPKEAGAATQGTLPLLGCVLFLAPYLGTSPGPEAGPRPGEQCHRVPAGGGEV